MTGSLDIDGAIAELDEQIADANEGVKRLKGARRKLIGAKTVLDPEGAARELEASAAAKLAAGPANV